jgi:hypothetical protein
MPDVILRDFDGTETVFAQADPLPEIIHTADEDGGSDLLETRHYIKSREVDSEDRPVYLESNL